MTEYVSKSEKKRQFKHTEKVAAELADLSNSELSKLDCSEQLKGEILATRGLKGGSRKRQVKYLAKVMRLEALDPIYEFLEQRKGSNLKSKQKLHEAERIRDTLINEALADYQQSQKEQRDWDMDWPSEEIAAVTAGYPDLVELELRKTIYSYAKTRNKTHYRELFRMVKAAIEQAEREKQST